MISVWRQNCVHVRRRRSCAPVQLVHISAHLIGVLIVAASCGVSEAVEVGIDIGGCGGRALGDGSHEQSGIISYQMERISKIYFEANRIITLVYII